MIKISKPYIAGLLVGTLVLGSITYVPAKTGTVYADELSEAEDKKADATQKKKEAEAKLSRLESEKSDILDVIEQLDTEILGYEEKIAELVGQRNVLQAAATIAEDDLQNAYIAEAYQYESMKERIQFAYENGDAAYIDALLSIKEYSSITNQSEYVSQVSLYDQKQLNALMEIEKEINEYRTVIETNISEVEQLKQDAIGEQEALEVMQNGKITALEGYNQEIAATEYSIEQLAAIEAQQDANIAAIEAQAAARRAAAEAAAQQTVAQQTAQPAETQNQQQTAQQTQQQTQQSTQPGTASPTDAAEASQNSAATTTNNSQGTADASQTANNNASANTNANAASATKLATYGGGGFKWPCPSSTYITSYYGARSSPTEGASSFHKGIDIGCSNGAYIVAVADGVVAYAGYMEGAGNAVIIDHGNGLSTCYFHLSGFAASVGANVTAGTTIAYAGSTGISTGPHLHFAVRVNGGYVDPMGYL